MRVYDTVIIGGGIVGTAVAFELSKYEGRNLLLEASPDVASGCTKANSAILHAGYDPEPNTLMAKTNVRGSFLAKEICEKLDVPRLENGALILAFSEADCEHLKLLQERGEKNGVQGIVYLSKEAVHALEPNLSDEVVAALQMKTSAIVDPWEYAIAMADTAVRNGSEYRPNHEVYAIELLSDSFKQSILSKLPETLQDELPNFAIHCIQKDQALIPVVETLVQKARLNRSSVSSNELAFETMRDEVLTAIFEGVNAFSFHKDAKTKSLESSDTVIYAKTLINAAGIHADTIHSLIGGYTFKHIPVRGSYYLLDKSAGDLSSHTLFQCPNEKGKGVLATPTVHGNYLLGPDAERIDIPDDTATSVEALDFVQTMAKRSLKSIPFYENIRTFAGVRSRSHLHDFIIEASPNHSAFINLGSIQSPGLSAAPAIAEEVQKLLLQSKFWKSKKKAKENFIFYRRRKRFRYLSREEQQRMIEENPTYGKIICRCESVTEGEILDASESFVPALTLESLKKHCNAGMGRCSAGFCGPRMHSILSKALNISPLDLLSRNQNSQVFSEETKSVNLHDLKIREASKFSKSQEVKNV